MALQEKLHLWEGSRKKRGRPSKDIAAKTKAIGAEAIMPRIIPNIYVRRPVENLVLPSSAQLVATAAQELKAVFKQEFEVPKPPAELFETLRAFAERRITGFDEVYYQPAKKFDQYNISLDFNGFAEPKKSFWELIKIGKYPAKVTELEEGWFIGDRRAKPMYSNGRQRYGKDDYLEPLMGYLRSLPLSDRIDAGHVPDNSRFGASALEIEKKVLPIFKEASGAKGIVRNRRYMEFNIRGNLVHPEWGKTNTYEWFADQVYYGAKRLIGGNSASGGLSDISHAPAETHAAHISFSPVVFFPSKASAVQ